MVDRISALHGHYTPGRFGSSGEAGASGESGPSGESGVTLTEVRDLTLHQIAAWPDTLPKVGKLAAKAVGAKSAPGPGAAVSGTNGALLRIEPLKWWMLGGQAPEIKPKHGATLDLSHSRIHLRVSGEQATALLNRHLPLDLRESSFAVGSVASSALHHVGVTLWRSEQGYELFIPRGFALSVWEVLVQTAGQFGAEIAP